VRSQHSAERLAADLTSRVGPHLSHKGYRLVSSGIGGVTWRRDWSGKLIAGLVVLSLFALGGIMSGDVGSTVFGVACGVAASALFLFRRPAEVAVDLASVDGGTELAVRGGRDASAARQIAEALA
jgi:hypothetical protein